MNDFALWPVLAGALAFFVVGALWYGVIFGRAWQKAAGITDEQVQSGNMPLIFGLCFLFALTGGLLPTSVLAATTDYTPRRDLIGTTNGLIMQGSNLGQMIGPPSVAALVTAFGSWTAAPLYVTSAAALGIAFALVIRRLRGRS